MRPDLDTWMQRPVIRINHRREANVDPAALWAAARSIRLADTGALGSLIRIRIPGLPREARFDDVFRSPPFTALHSDAGALVAGLVGRIWTLRRDYPTLTGPDEFRGWATGGTVRVVFATWVEPVSDHAAALVSETRVDAVDRRARLGLATLRPLIAGSHRLIASEGLDAAVKLARST